MVIQNNKLEQIQDDISYIVCFDDNTFIERKPMYKISDLCGDKISKVNRLIITYKSIGLAEIGMKNPFKLVFNFTVIGNTEDGITERILNFGYIDNNGDPYITELNLNTLLAV